MPPAPAVLTPERIDAMLSRTAEICMAGVESAGEWLTAAPDIESFERAGRALQTLGRNLRQTMALKQRFDREQVAVAAAQRRMADDARQDAERAHGAAVWRHQTQVRRHFERVLWDEYEADDAQEIFEELDVRLGQFGGDDTFLQTPVETLIARLTDEFVVEPVEDDASDDAAPEPDPEDATPETTALPLAMADDATSGPDEVEPTDPVIDTAPEPPPDPILPPPRPPDPPPAPYTPPWERLPRGEAMPSGTGW
ncbi:MAG: hypothetical protein KKE02_20255 [Alphaproteobacteria bacterium]|nr:hypothetical protein [Alphaproteobacteria bacterium]MBU1514807.1 hypothetical protein [Alphaproteobacteria bacterium]MBU2093938.1 hypothetical protein [Alphaproteobacteria bacterium]MBU2153365.1 hypothetical protein [Alphaproteobacteria bacterium]MBU2309793.1 hypothetical protein [Alphaproteobacteria bacterium]